MNLALFTPFALSVERRSDSGVYLFYLIVVGYAGAFSNFVGVGGLGVGISGLSYSVQAREAVFRARSLKIEGSFQDGLVFVIAAFLVVIGLLQAFGAIPSPQGAADIAHFVGISIGVIWQLFGLDDVVLR